jgi:hypothetical protein
MVVLVLSVRCELGNCASLELPELWPLTIKATPGDEVKEVVLDPAHSEEVGKGSQACLKIKFPGSAKEATMALIPLPKGRAASSRARIGAEQSGQWVPVAELDCRGLEPTHMRLERGGPYRVVTVDGEEHDEVDFGDLESVDYSESGQGPVSVTGLEARFEKQSKK